jgi:putative addiction module component (TIGR02574 family)
MAQTMESLKDQLAQLPENQRAELAQFLLHTLNGHDDIEDEEAWIAEMDRRAEEIKSGKDVCEPVEKVIAELRKKYAP